MIELMTSASYWIISLLWLIILALYLGKLKDSRAAGGAVAVLLTLLAIDAFRTLFESIYFGFYFNSMFGFLPHDIYAVLSKPGVIIIPKIVNIVAGVLVLTLLIRRWIPNEVRAQQESVEILQDTNRKLQESESRFRMLMEKIPIPFACMSKDGKNIFRNEPFVKLFGYSEDIVPTVDEWWLRAYPDPAYRSQVMRLWEQAVEDASANNNEVEAKEYLITCHNGEQRIIEISGIVLEYEVIVTFFDLTEKKRKQEEIEAARAEFAAIFNSISDAIVFVDEDRHIVRINPAFTKLFGYQPNEIAGQTTQLIYADPDDYLKQGQKRFNPDSKVDQPVFENIYRRKDGTSFPGETIGVHVVDESGKLLGYVGVIHDTSERKKAEKERIELEHQLQQVQKIESIGQLAGGVAHDFNNMLGVILGHTELALMKVEPTNSFVEDLEEIRTAAKRSADLTRQLLTFARKQTISPEIVYLNDTVAGMLKMLQRLIGANIQLSWTSGPDLWTVKMDPSQLDQMLANLCVNARDAIDGIGSITIETKNHTASESDRQKHSEVPSGEYVRLSVSDDGHGIDKEKLNHIFEPFFTTKEFGQGTGLGLSTVYGAIKQNQGYIEVDSEPGRGTTFHIYLPRQKTGVKTIEETTAEPLRQGTETILLVEDNQMLLKMVTSMLEKSGYQVLAAPTVDRAMSLAKEHPDPIHLLLSDLVMPEMNGKDLRDRLQVIRPEMKVIFMSGYSADIIAEQGVIEEGLHFLQKPVSYEVLTSKVREVLDQG